MYKLIGPVLVKQEQVEAKSNVDKRLEYIGGEMYVIYEALMMVCAQIDNIVPSVTQKTNRGAAGRPERKNGEEEARGEYYVRIIKVYLFDQFILCVS